jgi:hypothetical protein
MKNKRALEIDRRANVRALSEKLNFTKHLVGFWRDLEDNLHHYCPVISHTASVGYDLLFHSFRVV